MKQVAGYQPQKGQLNTLAQSGGGVMINSAQKHPITVNGEGTDLSTGAIRKRAKKKTITQPIMLYLIDVAREKGRGEKYIKAYWNTWHCQSRIYSADGRLYGKYCKNRFCPVCCGIRKAEIIHKYLTVIEQWENPHFVTLTIQSVPAKQLRKRMKDMMIAFRAIKDKYRKWHVKDKSIKLMGIKSMECNFNPVDATYNPHFHLIVPNKGTANILVQEWKKYWGYELVNNKAQDIREVTDPENCLVEVVKYGTKIFTDPLMKKKSEKKVTPVIYVSAIDNIIYAMKDLRIFERFGFDLPPRQRVKVSQSQILSQYDEWVHDPKQNDWINTEDCEQLLTGYTLTGELLYLLENNIDKELE